MNNNLDNLFKLLVPVVFMILWALNQLFNKENAPHPQQAGRPGGGLGPRPGGQPGSPALRPSPTPARPEGLGPRPTFPSPQPESSPAGDDEIVILRSESIQSPIGPRVSHTEPRRPRGRPIRTVEGRPARPARSPEPSPPRPQTPAIAQTPPPSPTPDSPVLIGVPPQLSAARIQQALNHPARVREAYLVSEILRPPVALRGRPGTRNH